MHDDLRGALLETLVLDIAQDLQRRGVDRADPAGSLAMRAGLGAGLGDAGAKALARQFHQSELTDPAKLDAGAVVLDHVLHLAFDRVLVARFVHVDEIDDDQPGEIPEPQLAGNLLGRLQIGLQRGFLDIALAGRAARVHVDCDQRLGLIEDDIPAGAQLNGGCVDPVQLVLDLEVMKQRYTAVAEGLDPPRMARHQHLHEALGGAIAFLALDQNLIDIAGIEVTDRALDQVGFLVHQTGRRGFQRQLADLVPEPEQILVVALDFGLGPLAARGAHDHRHVLGDVKALDDLFQALAVNGVGDLAADTAAARGIRHQHAIASGQ